MLFRKALYSWTEPKSLRWHIGLHSLRQIWRQVVGIWLGASLLVFLLFLLPLILLQKSPPLTLEPTPIALSFAIGGLAVLAASLNEVTAKTVKLYDNRIVVHGSASPRVVLLKDIRLLEIEECQDTYGEYRVVSAQGAEGRTILEILWDPLSSLEDFCGVLATCQVLVSAGCGISNEVPS